MNIGDKFYLVTSKGVNKTTYAGKHPNNQNYHILIDKYENPYRIYNEKFEAIKENLIINYEEAKLKYINKIKKNLLFWEETLVKEETLEIETECKVYVKEGTCDCDHKSGCIKMTKSS